MMIRKKWLVAIVIVAVGLGGVYAVKMSEQDGVIQRISTDKLEKIVNQEEAYVFFNRSDCPDCELFSPVLEEYIKSKKAKNIYKVELKEIRKNTVEWEKFKEKYKIQYTPTITLFHKGEKKGFVQWTPEKDLTIQEFKDWFEKSNKEGE